MAAALGQLPPVGPVALAVRRALRGRMQPQPTVEARAHRLPMARGARAEVRARMAPLAQAGLEAMVAMERLGPAAPAVSMIPTAAGQEAAAIQQHRAELVAVAVPETAEAVAVSLPLLVAQVAVVAAAVERPQ